MNTNSIHPHDQYYGFLKLGWKVSDKVIDAFLENYPGINLNSNQRNYLAVIFGDLILRPVDKLIAISANGEIPQHQHNPSKLTNRKILTVFDKLVDAACLTHPPHDRQSQQRRVTRYELNATFHSWLISSAYPAQDNIKSYDSGSKHSFIRYRHLTERDPVNKDKWIFIDPPYPITRATKKKNETLRRYNNKMYHWRCHLRDETPVIPNPLYSNFIGNRPVVVGRIQGGYLSKFNGEQRSNLLIDDEDTVYLDFQGFNTRALYALNNIQYNDDPYKIDGRSREKVKALATVVLNVDNGQAAKGAAVNSYKKKHPDGEDYTKDEAGDILQAFKDKHAAISECFFQPSYGSKLMSLEAEVAFEVVSVFVNQDKPILPIHDGFVVKEDDDLLLRGAMVNAYSDVFSGILPVITKD